MSVRTFRKKPVTIRAIQWTGDNLKEIWDTFGSESIYGPTENNPDWLIITTLEVKLGAELGAWIIEGVKGELYPCREDIFTETYEEVHEEPTE